MIFASIPSPSSPTIVEIGSLKLGWYGVLIATGIALAVSITGRQLRMRDRDSSRLGEIAIWVVALGLVGARLYHVVTDWELFSGHLDRLLTVQQRGLGIYGALIGGVLGAIIGARRTGVPAAVIFDCAAPGVALAQAIGRFGNYFNQELFGGPTTLPWALEIDPANRPPAQASFATFHPTFLYESLWNIVVCGTLLVIARRAWGRVAAGTLFALYLALYSFGRFFVEGLRIDPAHTYGPLRLNQIVAAVVCLAACAALVILRGRSRTTR